MSTVLNTSKPYEYRDDPVTEVIRERLWQSGSRAPRTELPDDLGVIITVGEASQPWRAEWYEQQVCKLTRRNFRLPIVVNARLVDARGMLDCHTAAATARFTHELLNDNARKVLIHCDAGHFRSVFMAALVAALWFRVDGTTALFQVRSCMSWRKSKSKDDDIGIPDYDAMLARWNRVESAPSLPVLPSEEGR